jgi:hypothetical protein
MKILRDWKVILAILLVFGAGAVTGSVLSFYHFKHAFESGLTVENWNSKTMHFLQKELKLTPLQETKVRAIVQETGGQFGETFSQAIRLSGTNLVISWQRIDQELTPEQRDIYHRKCEEFRAMLKKGLKIDLPRDTVQKEQRRDMVMRNKSLCIIQRH